MFLQRLEIAGFKSFAKRTVFHWGPGITAIVGPNGSGKSNVAEALRWAFGEQSSRSLRARRMEEVIFAGGSNRPPLEKAEVLVTLGRDGHVLTIGRRAYRSGEGEYLINGRKARLRDVQEALRDFISVSPQGLSYAFIGQGMVEGFLEMRPSERRRLMEEAADISRYKAVWEEVEGHIAMAREARAQLSLILRELQPRLQPLERQARRYALYLQLSNDLAQAQREYFGALWSIGQRSLAEARSQREEALRLISHCRCGIDEGRLRLAELEEKAKAKRQEAQELSRRRETLLSQIYRLEKEVALGRQRLSTLRERRQELEGQLLGLKAEISSSPRRERDAHADDLKALLDEARREERVAREQMEQVERRWQEAHSRLRELEEKASRLRLEANEALNRAQRWRRSPRQAHELAQSRRQIIADLTQELPLLRSLRSREAELKQQVGALATQVKGLEAENASTQVRAQRWQEEVQRLSALLQEYQQEKDELRREMEGLECLLGEILEVPPELEKAISAALGEASGALLVSGPKEALKGALAFSRNSRRVIIVPLQGLRRPPEGKQQWPGKVKGLASDLVRFPERFRPAVEALLGNVVVVEDLATAQQLLGQDGLLVVTMDGLVFYPWGGIAAGYHGRHAQHMESNRLAGRLKEAQQQLEEAQERMRRLRDERRAVTAELRVLEERLRATEKEIARREHRLARLKGELKAVMRAMAQVRQQEEVALKEAQALEETAHLLSSQAAAAEEEARQWAQKIASLAQERERALSRALEATSKRTAIEHQFQALVQEEERWRSYLQRLSQEQREKEEALSSTRRQEEKLSEELSRWEAELKRCRQALSQLPEPDVIIKEAEELEAESRNWREEIMALQEKLAQANRTLAEAEANERRWLKELEEASQAAQREGLPHPSSLPAPDIPDLGHLRERLEQLRQRLQKLGPVNPNAAQELATLKERYKNVQAQVSDFEKAEAYVHHAREMLEEWARSRFHEAFQEVSSRFQELFQSFFPGGQAGLSLTAGPEEGVEIWARPPGKKVRSLNQLSGGERALTALAVLFSLLDVNSFPFCVLDEADAMLDEANVQRFAKGLQELSRRTQFIVITHNRRTIEAADAVYGISMGPDGVSHCLSLSLKGVLSS